jgi:hypothetical protein
LSSFIFSTGDYKLELRPVKLTAFAPAAFKFH